MTKTLRIFFTGVGGQGNVLASKLLGEAALLADVPAVLSEIHGMSQRGGVVESTVVLGGAKSPVIADGAADVIVAFEPLEALRALRKANAATTVILSTAPVPPSSAAAAATPYPDAAAVPAYIAGKTGRTIALDARREAEEAGNPLGVNMVMLGALSAACELPVSEENLREAIARGTKPAFLEKNLTCFERGRCAVR